MIRKKGYEMKDYAAWLKAWETYNLHFYSVPAWLILALVFSLIAGIAFAVARGLAKKRAADRPGLLVNTMLVVSLAFAMLGGLVFLQSVRITAEMFKEPFTAVSEPLKLRLPIGEGHRSERVCPAARALTSRSCPPTGPMTAVISTGTARCIATRRLSWMAPKPACTTGKAKRCPLTEPPAGKDNHNQPSERKTR